MTKTIKIFAVDDHQLIIAGLKEIIVESGMFEWCGEAGNGKELLQALQWSEPDILLMDLNMPEMDGMTTVPLIKERYPAIKILILSMYDDNNIVRKVMKMGVDGFIPKNANPDELKGAIINIASGQKYFSPMIMESFIHEETKNELEKTDTFPKLQQLTEREIEVLKQIVNGLSNAEIAEVLFISKRTVDTHRSNIMKKLDVHSVVDLVKFAIKTGLA